MARRWTSEDDDPYDGEGWKQGIRPDEAAPEDPDGPGEFDEHLTDLDQPFSAECPHCGQRIDEDYEKCPHCHNWISREDKLVSQKQRNRRLWLFAVVRVLIFCFLACLGYLWWL
jgi:hypothetical protein